MELRQVEHFVAVVDHGGFTAAARAVRIVQSALSTSIRNLERELGAVLFERTTRRVALAEGGRAFLPYARRMLAEAEAGADAVRAVAGLARGRVSVGTIQFLGPVDLPAELASFHRRYPGVRISVLSAPTSALVDRLREGELDLAFLPMEAPLPEDLTGRPVYQEDLLLIMPVGHRLSGRDRVRWAELVDERFVDFAEGTAVSGIVQRTSAQLGLRRQVVGQVGQLDLQLALVRNGLGLAVVPGTLAISAPGVAVSQLVDPLIRWEVYLATRAPDPINPAARALRDHLGAGDSRSKTPGRAARSTEPTANAASRAGHSTTG